MNLFIIVFFLLWPFFSIFAEFSYLYKSSEGLLMGDAYTAVADDETTLFYNPAALGRHKGLSLNPINTATNLSDVLKKNARKLEFQGHPRYKNWPKSPERIAQRILNIPFHVSAKSAPGMKIENFGMSLFYNSTITSVLENSIHPNLNFRYIYDRGFIIGNAFIFGPKGDQTSFGMSIKHINREGLQNRFDLFGPLLIRLAKNSNSYKSMQEGLGYAKGKGWGADIGVEKVMDLPRGRLVLGASLLDVGEIHFKTIEGKYSVPRQRSSLNLGAAFSRKHLLLHYTFSADYKNAIDPMKSKKSKLSIGSRFKFPLLSIYLGRNGGYSTYGIGFNLFIFQFQFGFYSVETAYDYKQREGERGLLFFRLFSRNFNF